jgi:hypothetical protein
LEGLFDLKRANNVWCTFHRDNDQGSLSKSKEACLVRIEDPKVVRGRKKGLQAVDAGKKGKQLLLRGVNAVQGMSALA